MGSVDSWHQYCLETGCNEGQRVLDALLADSPAPRILEAGCGSASHFRFKPGARLVGIDLSQKQLDRNQGLSEKICGDLQAYDLSGGNYDAVICHFVLEHLDRPDRALANFVRGLAPNGAIVLVAPNPFSLFGLAAKLTPFWFHASFYRVFFGPRKGGGPFPTFYRLPMAPSRVLRWAARSNLKVEYCRLYLDYTTWGLGRKSRLTRWFLRALRAACKALTLGRLDPLLGTYTIILRRQST